MPITATVSWPTFPAGVPVTLARLRRAPGISLSGSIATGDLADGAVTPAKVSPGAYWYADSSAFTSNTYIVSLSPALSALADGVVVTFKAFNDNGDAQCYLNVNSLGAKKIFKQHQQIPRAGDIRNDQFVTVRYDPAGDSGTGAWQMLSDLGQPETRWLLTTGTANAQVLDFGGTTGVPTFKTAAAMTGRPIFFQASLTNTGPMTLTVDGFSGSVVKGAASPLVAGDVRIGEQCMVIYVAGTYYLHTPRQQALVNAWVKFNGTSTDKTITNAPTGNQLTVTGHGLTAATTLANVTAVSVRTSSALHGGLTANTVYYAYVVDANTLLLSTSRQGGLDGVTNIVTISGAGVGTNTLNYVTVNGSANVTAVIQTSDGSGSLLTGDFTVAFGTAFTGHYVMAGSVNGTGTVGVDASDVGVTTYRRIQTVNAAGTATAYAGTEVIFAGVLA